MKILLGRKEVKPDKPDIYGRTPVSIASGSGREMIVALLESRNVVTPTTIRGLQDTASLRQPPPLPFCCTFLMPIALGHHLLCMREIL